MRALNRLAKWRAFFTGWQLGTRLKGDPEGDAVRDHREATLLHRVELSTLASLLVAKGVFTLDEFMAAMESEAEQLELDLQKRFPGIRATDSGLVMDARAVATMKGWRP
jgi:hypothetical protein